MLRKQVSLRVAVSLHWVTIAGLWAVALGLLVWDSWDGRLGIAAGLSSGVAMWACTLTVMGFLDRRLAPWERAFELGQVYGAQVGPGNVRPLREPPHERV